MKMKMEKTSIVGITAICGALVLGYGCIAPQPQPQQSIAPLPPGPAGRPPPSGDFVETFDTPAGFYNRFVTQILHGFEPPEIQSWPGDHDDHCGAPTTSRTVHSANRAESFYWCGPAGPASGHIMTSMDTTGYAQVDFAPNQPFTGLSRVCWDQNQTDLGGRKWTQLVVVPEATFQANGARLDYVVPTLQNDVAVGGMRIIGETFLFEMLRGSTQTFVGQDTYDEEFAGFTTPDKARRFRTCITDFENGTVQVELERESSTDVRVLRGAFPNGPARVIFQDDSYNPPKDQPSTPSPFTWHWDNISIST